MYKELYEGLKEVVLQSGDAASKKLVSQLDTIAQDYEEKAAQKQTEPEKPEKKVSVAQLAKASRIIK